MDERVVGAARDLRIWLDEAFASLDAAVTPPPAAIDVADGAPPSRTTRAAGGQARSAAGWQAPPPSTGAGGAAADPSFLSASELRRAIASGAVSSEEATRALLERIERLDPRLGCYVSVQAEAALASARAADAERAGGRLRGRLHGVPMALKDIFDTAGVETASGARFLRGRVPADDAASVADLRAAGAVLIGKLNMHELAYGLTTNNPHFGPTRNPWALDHVPAGSSGGSSAALAAGLCHISLGTDTGGSIRLPAGACGIVGLKPTFGRVSRRGVHPLSWSLDHVGPMTRTVEDAALVLSAIAGPDPGDPWCSSRQPDDVLASLEDGVRGLRLGVPTDWFFDGVQDEVEEAVRAAIELLSREGADIVDVRLPLAGAAPAALLAIIGAEGTTVHRTILAEQPDEIGEDVRLRLLLGTTISAVDYVQARRVQSAVRADFAAALSSVDALLVPTMPHTAPPIGASLSRDPRQAWNRFMTPLNLAGNPAASIPCGFDRAGLPIGLQIVGRAWDEAGVLRVARAYERATDWHERRPAVALA